MTDRKKSAELKRDCLKLNFKKQRAAWEDTKDDRKLFCNLYDMLMEAVDTMETVENNYVWVAFNHEFKKDYETLEEISKRFEGR